MLLYKDTSHTQIQFGTYDSFYFLIFSDRNINGLSLPKSKFDIYAYIGRV